MNRTMGPVKITKTDEFNQSLIGPTRRAQDSDSPPLRDQQSGKPINHWRRLRSDEIETLVKNGNNAQSWDSVLVADPFRAKAVVNCEFSGLVRIGKIESVILTHHDLHVPAGLSNSRIIHCDIGDNAAIHHVRYLSHYLIGERCILHNVDEMHCTKHAKFGNGILKDGEDESVRVWMDLMNEAGGRAILPFDGITPADAYIWAKYRGDHALMERLKEMTQRQFDSRRGYFGTVGAQTVVKSCRIVKDVKVGDGAYIKGANKLKNLTVNSSIEEPSQIGEGVEMVNGILGYGCRVFYGCKAVRFVMGDNAALKYGARLIHSYLGDNSTVSCCELLSNLIFPSHEQHHNNSFLVAALVMGQSNMAAGATVGSNHNSRANDGEIVAGRGFWPGLCVTLKHSSKFASFCLLAKGDYPSELDIPLPFTLISNDESTGRLVLVPGYWWTHNMYALKRNEWKFANRDIRQRQTQHIEFAALAPDTVEEIIHAMDLVAGWTADAARKQNDKGDGYVPSDAERLAIGHAMLQAEPQRTDELEVFAQDVEHGPRQAIIRNPRRAYHAYRQMLLHYAMSNLLTYMQKHPQATLESLLHDLGAAASEGQPPNRQTDWINLGGQIVQTQDLDHLRYNIRSGLTETWLAVHEDYDRLWQAYPRHKHRHALAVLQLVLGEETITPELWSSALDQATEAMGYIRDQTHATRAKDYDNPYRETTFDDDDERKAVIGNLDDNTFIKHVQDEAKTYLGQIEQVRKRG